MCVTPLIQSPNLVEKLRIYCQSTASGGRVTHSKKKKSKLKKKSCEELCKMLYVTLLTDKHLCWLMPPMPVCSWEKQSHSTMEINNKKAVTAGAIVVKKKLFCFKEFG